MAHGLGSARDFGHEPEEVGLSPEELALNAELLGGQPEENLGPDDEGGVSLEDITVNDPFEDAEVGEYLGEPGQTFEGNPDELAALAAYLQAFTPEYVVTPHDLRDLVEGEIITTDEARDYLERKGVLGG